MHGLIKNIILHRYWKFNLIPCLYNRHTDIPGLKGHTMKNALIIEKNGKYDSDFDKILWTLKARSKDETRHNLMGVKINDGFIVCTDGHRLHMAGIDREIANGLYNVKSVTKKQVVLELNENEDDIYPDYTRIFPKFEPTYTESYNGNKSFFVCDILQKMASENECFELDFLTDAYMENTTVEMMRGYSSLYLYDDEHNRTALIMPLKAH